MDKNNFVLDNKLWEVSNAFIDHYGVASAHLESYNYAIEKTIPNIVQEKGFAEIDYCGETHKVRVIGPYFHKPFCKELDEKIRITTPKMCEDIGISYVSGLYFDIVYEGPKNQHNVYNKVYFGEIPVMVKSILCNLYKYKNDLQYLADLQEDVCDVGGYFILNGALKTIIHQVRPSHNNVHTYEGKPNSNGKHFFPKYAETRSGSSSSHTTTTQVGVDVKSNFISVVIPLIDTQTIPLGILFRALGAKTEKEMANYVFNTEWFENPPTPKHKEAILLLTKTLEQSWQITSQNYALDYIGKCAKKNNIKKNNENKKKIDFDKEKPVKENKKESKNIEFVDEILKIDVENTDSLLLNKDSSINAEYAKHLLSTQLLPHIGTGESSFKEKCVFIGYMTQRFLLYYVDLIPASDRDHYANKRIHTSGMLLSSQFYKFFRQMMNKIMISIENDAKKKKVINISSYISHPSIITTGFIKVIVSDKWSKNSASEQGISQPLDNFNMVSKYCFLRKFVIPIPKEGAKIEKPRHINGSSWGGACIFETPESEKVGLVQSFAMGAIMSVGSDHLPMIEFLKSMEITAMENVKNQDDFHKHTKIFVNGAPNGFTKNPQNIVDKLRLMRRNCNINPEISIAFDTFENEIKISTDAGRLCRGLIILNKGKMLLTEKILDEIKLGIGNIAGNVDKSTWINLLEKGYVEIISKDEEEMLNIVVYPSDLKNMNPEKRAQYTHCEMTPDMLEGVGVSTSPFNDHNQAPRNIYQAGMSKQSVGIPGINNPFRRQGKWHVMQYPQKPIVNTRICKKLFETQPIGQNATICVMPWYGFNQEDSLIFCGDAINRGFMCSYMYIAYESIIENMNISGAVRFFQTFEIPDKDCNDFRGNTEKLKCYKDKSGNQWCHVPIGVEVKKGDILIGMTISYVLGENHFNQAVYPKKKTNVSIIYDQKWPSIIHSVNCGLNGKGYHCINLVTQQYRKPVCGDKFSGMHGQKGIIGVIYPAEKMPFLIDAGYTPNILLNPLAFPSRMTIGMLIENILGVALTGSALKSPEYNMPLCLDSFEDIRPNCMVKDWENDEIKYLENFKLEDYKAGLTGDATPFKKNFSLSPIIEAIKKMGIDGFGEERFLNPITNTVGKCLIYSGVVYYQRLKHMVVDKMHARSTGSLHALHHQPTEGRTKKGGYRVGHMERDVLVSNARINLREGISISMGTLERFENVWGWNSELDGLQKSKQINFGRRQNRPKYVMTLQDGRKIEGSNNHPFYTKEGEYSDMKYLEVGIDRVVCSIDQPFVDFEEDMLLCRKWIWNSQFFANIHKDRKLPTKYETFRRSLALARLVGLIITDGRVYGNNILVFPDHTLDVETVNDDVNRITGKNPEHIEKIMMVQYALKLPIKLSKVINEMGIIEGSTKVNQQSFFPDFITKKTPLPILREFLGGLFGGDGHTVCLSTHRDTLDFMKSVAFSWTRDEKNLQSLQKNMEFLQELLLRFEIKSCMQNPKLTADSKKTNGIKNNREIVLNIPIDNLVKFSERIGFRYCENKSIKLAAEVSYRRFREGCLRQRQWICDRVDEITNYSEIKKQNEGVKNTKIDTKRAIEQATRELRELEPILHQKSIPDRKIVARIMTGIGKNEFRCQDFPTVDQYLTEIGAIDMFFDIENPKKVTYGIPKDKKVIPGFNLLVLEIKNTGEREDMCDITIEGTESYVANGMIAHNCMLGQGMPEMVLDRLLHQSDSYIMPVCQICGLTVIDDGTKMYCRLCQTSKANNVRLPFGTKLMSQELAVMNLIPRIITLPTNVNANTK